MIPATARLAGRPHGDEGHASPPGGLPGGWIAAAGVA